MKTHLFQSCGHCWVFQICWHIECSTFTVSSLKQLNWNSITSTSFVLSKAHLTLYSRMSGSRWVITSSWLSGLWRSFLYSSSVYSYHLFLITSTSVRSIPFLSFFEPIFAWNVPSWPRLTLVMPQPHWGRSERSLIHMCTGIVQHSYAHSCSCSNWVFCCTVKIQLVGHRAGL